MKVSYKSDGTAWVEYEKFQAEVNRGKRMNKRLEAKNERLKRDISITLSEIENRLTGIDFEMIERRLEHALKGTT